MHAVRTTAIVLIIAGCLGLIYDGFSYTSESTGLKLGALELKVLERKTINVPVILSGGALTLGVFLLFFKVK